MKIWKKKNKRIIKIKRLVKYYWFIAIVNNNKQRIKIIIKKIDWFKNFEYVSVISYWKVTKNWPQLYDNKFEI